MGNFCLAYSVDNKFDNGKRTAKLANWLLVTAYLVGLRS